MYNFILQTVMFASFALVVYLFVRALPRVPDATDEKSGRMKAFQEKISERIPFDKMDKAASASFEKILRRIRLFVMKLDNKVQNHLNSLKKRTKPEEGVHQPDETVRMLSPEESAVKEIEKSPENQ